MNSLQEIRDRLEDRGWKWLRSAPNAMLFAATFGLTKSDPSLLRYGRVVVEGRVPRQKMPEFVSIALDVNTLIVSMICKDSVPKEPGVSYLDFMAVAPDEEWSNFKEAIARVSSMRFEDRIDGLTREELKCNHFEHWNPEAARELNNILDLLEAAGPAGVLKIDLVRYMVENGAREDIATAIADHLSPEVVRSESNRVFFKSRDLALLAYYAQ